MALSKVRKVALEKLEATFERRHRDTKRAHLREMTSLPPRGSRRKEAADRHVDDLVQLRRDRQRLHQAVDNTTQRLVAVVALRLVRASEVSA